MEFWQGVLMVSSQSSVASLAAMESGRGGFREVVGLIPADGCCGWCCGWCCGRDWWLWDAGRPVSQLRLARVAVPIGRAGAVWGAGVRDGRCGCFGESGV